MFTTGLKADDVAVTGIAGLRPLGQVTGACASRSGFYRGHGKMVGGPGKVYLYPEAVAAVRATREQAVRAMARDAAALGADAVVGIHVSHGERPCGDRDGYGALVESAASGIAVTWQGMPPGAGEPVLTNLDVQGCLKLFQCGYAPVGMVMSTVMTGCVARRFRAVESSLSTTGARYWSADQYPDAAAMVTMGYRAMGEEIREQGLAMGAEGIIGVEFQRRTWGHELATRRSGIMCRDFKMILTVAGTAIAAAGKESGAAAPRTGLRITPVRHVT